MKSKTLILIYLLFPIVNFAQTLNCAKFTSGIYYIPQAPDYGYSVRNEKTQTSYYKNSTMIVTWLIKWTSDCTYELRFKKAENGEGFYKKGDMIKVVITSIDGDCYTYNSIFYNDKNPKGEIIPEGQMCLKAK